jgi:hypothetical protein
LKREFARTQAVVSSLLPIDLFNSRNNCHKNGFCKSDSLRLTADAQKKRDEKQQQKKRASFAVKKDKKGF